jgi:hypothetical protein
MAGGQYASEGGKGMKSPLPWEVKAGWLIVDKDGRSVASTREQDAEHIVTAVNSYEAMKKRIAELEKEVRWIKEQYDSNYGYGELEHLFKDSALQRAVYETCEQLLKEVQDDTKSI